MIGFIILIAFVCCSNAFLIVTLNSRSVSHALTREEMGIISPDQSSPLKIVYFCTDCDKPHEEGSIANALEAKFGPKNYLITAEAVLCVPNLADSPILNSHQFSNRIVLVFRGRNTLFDKVSRIQHAGAAGIIIFDDGSCGSSELFTSCGTRVGSAKEGGLAAYDDRNLWASITIPVVIVSTATAARFRNILGVREETVPVIGSQWVAEVRDHSSSHTLATETDHSFDSLAILNGDPTVNTGSAADLLSASEQAGARAEEDVFNAKIGIVFPVDGVGSNAMGLGGGWDDSTRVTSTVPRGDANKKVSQRRAQIDQMNPFGHRHADVKRRSRVG